ncbi:hypothetical protein GCM10009710_19480 [Aeromicrobium alkaliterrae]|uniref:Flp family type IVb pilin n=2 Tax=Aeromicrobium alkaliterrae TaxID=302168 RepID=A0ABN2JUB4_9ACTN
MNAETMTSGPREVYAAVRGREGCVMKTIRKVHQAERGATSVEYALLIVVIAVIIAGTVLGMGEAIGALFDVVPF